MPALRSIILIPLSLAMFTWALSGTGGAAPVTSPAQLTTDQAVTYQINVAHTGNQPNDTLAPPLTEKWRRNFGAGVSYPLIAGGSVFVTVPNPTSYNGSRLFALDEASGATLWSRAIAGTYGWSAAAYDAGMVFVVNFDGVLRAYDAATGAPLWSRQLPGQYAFSSPPTAADGRVYVGGAGSGGTLYAVDEATGGVLWTDGVANGDDSSPALSATSVFVSYACPQSYAFNRITGKQRWQYSGPCEGGGGATPVYYKGRVYVGDVTFYPTSWLILDAKTGDNVGGLNSDRLPVFAGSLEFLLYAGTLEGRDASTGTLLWSFAGDGSLSSTPIVVGKRVYIGSSNGRLFAVNPRTGHAVWHADVGADVGPMGAGEGLLVVSASNLLVAYQ